MVLYRNGEILETGGRETRTGAARKTKARRILDVSRRAGRKRSDAIFVTAKASGHLTIGDKKEIDKATWRKPRGIRLTPTSRYIRDKLFPKGQGANRNPQGAPTVREH